MEKNAGWKKHTYVRAWAAGLGGIALLLILLLLCALCALHVPALQGREALLGHAALVLAALAVACAAAGVNQDARPAAVGICLGMLLLFLLAMALASEGSTVANLSMLFSLLCLAGAGLLALMLGKPRRHGRKRKR